MLVPDSYLEKSESKQLSETVVCDGMVKRNQQGEDSGPGCPCRSSWAVTSQKDSTYENYLQRAVRS